MFCRLTSKLGKVLSAQQPPMQDFVVCPQSYAHLLMTSCVRLVSFVWRRLHARHTKGFVEEVVRNNPLGRSFELTSVLLIQ